MVPTHVPVISSRPHLCNMCARSFATRKALTDHSRSTGHALPCTISKCKKTFLSNDALQAHLSSPAHFSPALAATRIATVNDGVGAASGTRRDSALGHDGVLSFKCTVSGCGRSFNSKSSRKQHLNSSIHKATLQTKAVSVVKSQETQNDVKTGATGGQSGASNAGNVQQPTQFTVTDPTSGRVMENHSAVAMEPEAPSAKSIAAPEKTINEPKSRQKQTIVSLEVPDLRLALGSSSLLYIPRLDSRWSVIPAVQYASAMAALNSRISKAAVLPKAKSAPKFHIIDPMNTPAYSTAVRRRRAVALDCEMVSIGSNASELARISAIDYLTGEVLIDTLVQPLHAVTDWRTQWSGVTAQAMNAAIASGTALQGTPEARSRLFEFVDAETVLVGHALHHDLAALGLHHQNTVDSAVLAKKAVAMGAKKQWGLKALCNELLGLSIQDNGNKGHDSVEDAFAAREVVLWCLQNQKELKAWGKKKKNDILEANRIRNSKRNARMQKRRSRVVYDYSNEYNDSDGSEFRNLSLEQFNELCGYPSWYDNWSD